MAQNEAGEFTLIITEIDGGQLEAAAQEFARVFSLDGPLAVQICRSAPIIFAQKLTKAEVKAITPKLAGLSSKGMEFRVTARVAGKIPKVNWPVRPQFTAGGSGGAVGLAFEWDNNAVVCPSCGETFLFRRLGQLKLAGSPADPETEAPPAPPPKAAPPPEEPLMLAEEAAEPAEPEPQAEPDSMEEVAPQEEAVLEAAEPLEEVTEASAVEEGEFSVETQEPLETVSEAPAAGAPATAAAAGGGGELYNVFLSKITDNSRRGKAAELIAKTKGCSMAEANDLTTRLVIPLVKNVPKEAAEEILNSFKKLKIFGRMTKVK